MPKRIRAEARVMEKGYSLKSLVAASRVEALLLDDGHGERLMFFSWDRRIGSAEKWKAD